MTFFFFFTLFCFLFFCAILIFVILIQESKTMGLGASFGGDTSDSLFGTSTADVLKKFTAYMVVIFMSACILLSVWSTTLGAPKGDAIVPPQEALQ